MNSFTICILAISCVMQMCAAGPLDQLQLQLKKSKNDVQSTMSDLQRFQRNLQSSSSMKFSNLVSQSMQNINNFVNPAINSIRTDVDAAKENGKDVENCYTTAKQSLRSVSQTGFSDLNQCRNDAEQRLKTQLSGLDTVNAEGQRYLSQLDSIFLNCYSSNLFQMQSCIAINLGTTNSAIRTWKNSVESAKTSAERSANNEVLSVSSCNNNVLSSVRVGTTNARIAASKCINN